MFMSRKKLSQFAVTALAATTFFGCTATLVGVPLLKPNGDDVIKNGQQVVMGAKYDGSWLQPTGFVPFRYPVGVDEMEKAEAIGAVIQGPPILDTATNAVFRFGLLSLGYWIGGLIDDGKFQTNVPSDSSVSSILLKPTGPTGP